MQSHDPHVFFHFFVTQKKYYQVLNPQKKKHINDRSLLLSHYIVVLEKTYIYILFSHCIIYGRSIIIDQQPLLLCYYKP